MIVSGDKKKGTTTTAAASSSIAKKKKNHRDDDRDDEIEEDVEDDDDEHTGRDKKKDSSRKKTNAIAIDPSIAKSDTLFWRTYQGHLRKSLSLSRRIQAFDTAVYIAEPGVNVAEKIYINEDGVSVSVLDDEEHDIPDFEMYTARIEELSKHSGEETKCIDAKVDQIIHSPGFAEVSNKISYFQVKSSCFSPVEVHFLT